MRKSRAVAGRISEDHERAGWAAHVGRGMAHEAVSAMRTARIGRTPERARPLGCIAMARSEEVSDKVLTAANAVSFVRLCMIPLYLVLLLCGHDLAATLVFAAAAATDFLDGQIARRTHTVTRLGQLLDPAVDRLLMITGVLGVFLVGRLPLWIILVVLVRDGLMLVGGWWLLTHRGIRIPVVYPGKVATTLLFVGFAGLLLNQPLVPGLGWCAAPWLPGFNAEAVSWGIWFIYAGMALALGTTVYYVGAAVAALRSKGEAGEAA